MRQIGAQSLKAICELDLVKIGPDAATRAVGVSEGVRIWWLTCSMVQAELLKLPDAGDIHGGLLALTELATAFRDSPQHEQLEAERRKVRQTFVKVVPSIVQNV